MLKNLFRKSAVVSAFLQHYRAATELTKEAFSNFVGGQRFGQRYGVRAHIPEGTPYKDLPLNSEEGPAISMPSESLPEVEPVDIFPIDLP